MKNFNEKIADFVFNKNVEDHFKIGQRENDENSERIVATAF